jgi:hypothetical protein
MVFFGIRSYRDNVADGKITFEIIYFNLMPDFLDKYAQHMIEKAKAAGHSQQMIDAQIQEMKNFKTMYDNPFINAAFTFLEPFPVGLIITLISSAILRRR